MDATRPRPSILSLFDPLSSQVERSLSPDSDKENHGETSFFHPSTTSRVVAPPLHKLRRRLIDVGDMTVDEPDIRGLLADEVEELGEELNQYVADDDENATLTFRDMAKAASPKWSGRHVSTVTSKSPTTPRTPLADISIREETTPMARKKPYKRRIALVASKHTEVVEPSSLRADVIPDSSSTHCTTPERALQPASPPTIEISSDKDETWAETDMRPSAGASQLGSSICTLDLPTSSDALLSDTPTPVLISPSSPSQTTQEASPVLSPSVGSRLKPRASFDQSHRHSIDLQTSFHLQLNADTTFDLLNDKIPFFASKSDHDSFLTNLEEDASFGEEGLGQFSSKSTSLNDLSATSKKRLSREPPVADVKNDSGPEVQTDAHINNLSAPAAPEKALKLVDIESPPKVEISARQQKMRTPTSPAFAVDEKASNAISTPHYPTSILQHPPRPVPALKIVKRSRTLLNQQVGSGSTAAVPPRRRSSIASAQLPLRWTTTDSSSETTSVITSYKRAEPRLENKMVRRVSAVSAFSNPSQSGDGPRRVLISEGPKLTSISRTVAHSEQGKTSTGSGPRRIALHPAMNITERTDVPVKPGVQANSSSGLRQPVKYATVGPLSASAIPKPVSRPAGSKMPAPSGNGKQRFGVQTGSVGPSKGLSSRRVL